MTVTDRTAATDAEFRSRIAAFDGADEAEESLRERLIDALDAELDSLGLSQGISSRAAYHLAQTALDVVTTPVIPAAVAVYRAQDGGTCGDLSPSINFGGDSDAERLMCELPVGHGGAHQHDNGDGLPPTRWIATQDGGAEEAVRRVEAVVGELDAARARSSEVTARLAYREAADALRAALAPQADR